MTEQQQVALIQTILFFMGKQQYGPTSNVILAQLRQMTAASTTAIKTYDVSSNKALTPTPPPATTKTWDVAANKAVATPPVAWNTSKMKAL